MKTAKDKRRAAYRQGHFAEFIAKNFLRLKGFRMLGARVKTPKGELDLIMRRGPVVLIAEVKWRNDPAAAINAVSPHQARRIIAAARYWLGANPAHQACTCRFDIIAVSSYLWPVHIANAFSEDLF